MLIGADIMIIFRDSSLLERLKALFSHGLFAFSVGTPESKRSLLHFTAGESVVNGDCRLNLLDSLSN